MNLSIYVYDHEFDLTKQDQVIVSETLWKIYGDMFRAILISSVGTVGKRKL